LRCLVEEIERVDLESKQHPKEQFMIIQVVFSHMMLSKQEMTNDEASQPQQESALDHKWFLFHMGKEWISLLMIGLHQAYNWTSHCY
jgi:hypothetical protein